VTGPHYADICARAVPQVQTKFVLASRDALGFESIRFGFLSLDFHKSSIRRRREQTRRLSRKRARMTWVERGNDYHQFGRCVTLPLADQG